MPGASASPTGLYSLALPEPADCRQGAERPSRPSGNDPSRKDILSRSPEALASGSPSRLLRMFKDASPDYTRGAHDYRDLLRALFNAQPAAALNEMFTGVAKSVRAAVRLVETFRPRRASPLDGIPPVALISWCRIAPDTRYAIAADVGSLFKKDSHAALLQWSSLAPVLLQNASDPAAMLSLFVKRLYPSSWGGSWPIEMESRFRLLEQLDVDFNADLEAARKHALDRLRSQIEEARVREAAEDRQRNARFE